MKLKWFVTTVGLIGVFSILFLAVATERSTPAPQNQAALPDHNEDRDSPPVSYSKQEDNLLLPAIERRVAEMEVKLDQLAKAYHAVERQLQTVARADTTTSESATRNTADDVVQSDLAKKQARLSFLATELAVQGFDPSWSKQATENIAATFDGEALPGSSLLGAQCGKTLCRLEVRHADEGSQARFFDGFFPTLRWETSATGDVTDNQDGTYNTVLFISRQDHALPSPPSTSIER